MARWSEVVNLIGLVEGTDEMGWPIEEEVERTNIFANKKSVRSNEYYLAKQGGVELQHMFEIRSIDYQGEEKLRYNGEVFEIERTYDKGEVIELVCSRRTDEHAI